MSWQLRRCEIEACFVLWILGSCCQWAVNVDDGYERVLGNYMRWGDFVLKEPKPKKT